MGKEISKSMTEDKRWWKKMKEDKRGWKMIKEDKRGWIRWKGDEIGSKRLKERPIGLELGCSLLYNDCCYQLIDYLIHFVIFVFTTVLMRFKWLHLCYLKVCISTFQNFSIQPDISGWHNLVYMKIRRGRPCW